MTENDYIARLKAAWPTEGSAPGVPEATVETLQMADEAVRAFPGSAKLWVMRGDLIQLGCEAIPHSLEEALVSYQSAANVDPGFAEAHESIGYYYDVIDVDLDKSLEAFSTAIACGGGVWTHAGMARVLAERGAPREEVIQFLDACPFCDHPVLLSAREDLERTWRKENQDTTKEC